MKNSFWVDKIVFLWYNDVTFSPYRREVTKGARLTALYARIVRDFGLLTDASCISRFDDQRSLHGYYESLKDGSKDKNILS